MKKTPRKPLILVKVEYQLYKGKAYIGAHLSGFVSTRRENTCYEEFPLPLRHHGTNIPDFLRREISRRYGIGENQVSLRHLVL